jgi:hypothetical protein
MYLGSDRERRHFPHKYDAETSTPQPPGELVYPRDTAQAVISCEQLVYSCRTKGSLSGPVSSRRARKLRNACIPSLKLCLSASPR